MKSFREKYKECVLKGNILFESCHRCGQQLLICKKYGGQCISSKCRKERENG